jgi:hypothetical protein
LNASAICPSVAAQSAAGNRTEKSPSRYAVIAARIIRERTCAGSSAETRPAFRLAGLPWSSLAEDGDFLREGSVVVSFMSFLVSGESLKHSFATTEASPPDG